MFHQSHLQILIGEAQFFIEVPGGIVGFDMQGDIAVGNADGFLHEFFAIMRLVERLKHVGMVNGGAADILLDGKDQLAFIRHYDIDLNACKITNYRCVLFPNNGRRAFKSPVLGFSDTSELSGMSLQVGGFSLLQFRQLAPLLPNPVEGCSDRFYLNLYSIPWQTFEIGKILGQYPQ